MSKKSQITCCRCDTCGDSQQVSSLNWENFLGRVRYVKIKPADIGCIVKFNGSIPHKYLSDAFLGCRFCIDILTKWQGISYIPSVSLQKEIILKHAKLCENTTGLVVQYLGYAGFAPEMFLQLPDPTYVKCISLQRVSSGLLELREEPLKLCELPELPELHDVAQLFSHLPQVLPFSSKGLPHFRQSNEATSLIINVSKIKELVKVYNVEWVALLKLLLIIFKNVQNCKIFMNFLNDLMSVQVLDDIQMSCIHNEYLKSIVQIQREDSFMLNIRIVFDAVELIVQELHKKTHLDKIPEIVIKRISGRNESDGKSWTCSFCHNKSPNLDHLQCSECRTPRRTGMATKSCVICTYANKLEAIKCAVCETPFEMCDELFE